MNGSATFVHDIDLESGIMMRFGSAVILLVLPRIGENCSKSLRYAPRRGISSVYSTSTVTTVCLRPS